MSASETNVAVSTSSIDVSETSLQMDYAEHHRRQELNKKTVKWLRPIAKKGGMQVTGAFKKDMVEYLVEYPAELPKDWDMPELVQKKQSRSVALMQEVLQTPSAVPGPSAPQSAFGSSLFDLEEADEQTDREIEAQRQADEEERNQEDDIEDEEVATNGTRSSTCRSRISILLVFIPGRSKKH